MTTLTLKAPIPEWRKGGGIYGEHWRFVAAFRASRQQERNRKIYNRWDQQGNRQRLSDGTLILWPRGSRFYQGR